MDSPGSLHVKPLANCNFGITPRLAIQEAGCTNNLSHHVCARASLFSYLQGEVVLEVRNIVADVAPGATEDIRHEGLVYYFEESGGPVSAGICGVSIKPDHVRLYFTHGAFILIGLIC